MVYLLTCLLFSALMCIASVSGGSLEESSLLFQNPRNITAESGENILLPCRAPDAKSILAVLWSRADLGSEYVLLYRNGHIDRENQYPLFKNRVDLQDRQIKNGDVSLVLMNVTNDDRGTYYCQMVLQVPDSRTETFSINLVVIPPPPPGEPEEGTNYGYVALGVVLGFILLVLPLAGYFICNKLLKKKQSQEPTEELSGRRKPLMDQNGTELSELEPEA